MLKLQSVFPKEINEHTYDAYFGALKKWKIEYIESAALRFIGKSTFFPLPKDFNEYLWNEVGASEMFLTQMQEPTNPLPRGIEDILEQIGEAPKKELDKDKTKQ